MLIDQRLLTFCVDGSEKGLAWPGPVPLLQRGANKKLVALAWHHGVHAPWRSFVSCALGSTIMGCGFQLTRPVS